MRRRRRIRDSNFRLPYVQATDCPVCTIQFHAAALENSKNASRNDVETIIHSDNDFATVAYSRIKDACLADKDPSFDMPITAPPLLLPEFQGMMILLKDSAPIAEDDTLWTFTPLDTTEQRTISTSSCKLGNWVSVSNVQQAERDAYPVSEEVASCFKILQGK